MRASGGAGAGDWEGINKLDAEDLCTILCLPRAAEHRRTAFSVIA